MASGPISSWQIDEETMKTMRDLIFLGCEITVDCDHSHEIKRYLFFGAPKSLQMVIAAMKLKDAYSLEGKLGPT